MSRVKEVLIVTKHIQLFSRTIKSSKAESSVQTETKVESKIDSSADIDSKTEDIPEDSE